MATEEQGLPFMIGGVVLEVKPVIISALEVVCQHTLFKVLNVMGSVLKLSRDLEHFNRVPGCAFVVEPTDHSFDGITNLIK